MYVNHTNLLALRDEVVDSLLSSLTSRTHEDDDVLSVLSTIVVEAVVVTTSDLGHLLTVLLYYVRDILIICVACLTVCEELVWILSSTTCYRALWRECTVTELLDILHRSDSLDVLHVHNLDLMILVRCTETIKEVYEWNLCLKSSEVRNGCKVHNLLNRA